MSKVKTEEKIGIIEEENLQEIEDNMVVNEQIEVEECEGLNGEAGDDEAILDLKKQLQEAQNSYLRVHADFENIKKRLEKEKYQAIDYASEKFAKDLLSPIDSLEMAMSSADLDLSSDELLTKLKEGIALTIKNFYTVFEKHDISTVETNSTFDPNFHNAVMKVEDEEKEEGDIVQVMQKGYKYKDRLLRPAMVSVCGK